MDRNIERAEQWIAIEDKKSLPGKVLLRNKTDKYIPINCEDVHCISLIDMLKKEKVIFFQTEQTKNSD